MTSAGLPPEEALSAPTSPSSGPLRLRVALEPESAHPGRLAGVWWPYSRDLTRELPLLEAMLDRRQGRIRRAGVARTRLPCPRGNPLPPGRPARRAPLGVPLFSYRVGRWDLLVIPPETDPATATALLAAVSRAASRRPRRRR
ncbi:DUF5994 family protein [Streptomyces capparidis]